MESNYVLKQELGSGSFGYVFLALNTRDNKNYAIKRIKKVGDKLSREVEILQEIQGCRYCVKMLECFYTEMETETERNFVQNIVFEYLERDLYKLIRLYLNQKKKIPIKTIKNISLQIFLGLDWLNNLNLVHRDLKPENVLLDNDDNVKICDFGSAKFVDKKGKNSPYVVSQYYRAPELFFCMINYTNKIDIWAAACILCELILLKPIFIGQNDGDQIFCIMKLLGSPSSEEKEYFLNRAPFLEQVFNRIPEYTRNDKYIKNLANLLESEDDKDNFLNLFNRIFIYNPEKRLSTKEIIHHPFYDDVRYNYNIE